MNKYTLLITLISFTLTACGGNVDMRSLVERLDNAEARASAAEERNATLIADNEALMTGRPRPTETSGGEAAPAATPAPVRVAAPTAPTAPTAPAVNAPRMTSMMPSAPARSNVLQMCDGVDGRGMLETGVLTSSMAFMQGSAAGTMNHLVLHISNESSFDIAFSLNGVRVHTFSGTRPIMMADTSGTCAMPIIPSRTGPTSASFTKMNMSLIDYADQTEHVITYSCYRSAGGRIATRPTAQGRKTLRMSGDEATWQITGADCGDYRLGA